MSSTAARLSLPSPTSAYLAVRYQRPAARDAERYDCKKKIAGVSKASVLCFPCKIAQAGAEQIFRVLHGTVLRRGRRRPGKPTAAGLKIHRADTRRDCRQPEFTPARTTCHGRFPASFGPALPKNPERQNRSGANLLCLWRLVSSCTTDGNGFYRLNPQSVPLRLVRGYLRLSASSILITPSRCRTVFPWRPPCPRNTSIRLIFWGASRKRPLWTLARR